VQVTATYTPSQEEETSEDSTEGTDTDANSRPPTVHENPREEEVSLTYLDFWIAGSEESNDDVLIVRPTIAQSSDQGKKVIHWAKVVVKHSVPGELPLLLQSAGSKPLYFYGEQNDPNQLSEEPELKEVLEQPYANNQYFWVGTDAKGEGTATIQAQGNLGTGYKNAPEQKTLKLVPVEVITDCDRDGIINDDDRGKISDGKPFVFWVNDDDDDDEKAPHFGDVPQTNPAPSDLEVKNRRDLLDFFPVQLRLKELLAVLPPEKYSYRIAHPEGAFHFIEMPLVQPDSGPQGQGAGSYLANRAMADFALERAMLNTEDMGAELSPDYLFSAKSGMGVILVEAKSATNQPFEIIISEKKKRKEVVRILRALPVEIVENPESLYWRVNIRDVVKGDQPGEVKEPSSKWFKDSRKDQWFVFCHGYNVNTEAARGWNSEIFKRLYHKGCNARFLGVSWEGCQGQLEAELPFEFVFTPDYWRNAYNAFVSSHALANIVNNLPGNNKSKTIIAGHSMGNLLVSSAICDHGLNTEKYFLLNAAVAREAYNANYVQTDRNSVCHPEWVKFPARLWSSDWFNFFPSDARKNLTWQGRFGNLAEKTTPHNYYSSTEDVLDNGKGKMPPMNELLVKDTGAWVKQEMSKGLATKAFVTGSGSGNWTSCGGWGFNPDTYLNYRSNPLDLPTDQLPDTKNITENELRSIPFFKPFTRLAIVKGGAVPDSSNGIDLSSSKGSEHPSQYAIRAWLLCHDIPAISNPTGKNEVQGWSQNIDESNTDMNKLKSINWGAWKHSDLKNADMDVVGGVFAQMVTRGNLK
jgi:pimeloyl-ACP methyl ester carboxylesterase